MDELKRLEGDESMLELYEARLDQVRVMATELEGSYEEGREKAAREIARRLVARGDSLQDVASLTGLSVDTIQSL